jgi:integrase
MVRILAYHGMRSGEAAHLRCEDVTVSMGVPILRLTEEAGSKKNAPSIRDVPTHPIMLEEITARAKALGSGWLFPSFPTWKGKRGSWFQRNGGTFLRRIGIIDKAHTMHSLRHLWRTLAREMNMPRAVSLAIMGHSLGKDDHEGYGGVPSLKVRTQWMAQINPLA